jgi:hypothetical protein
MSRFPFEEYKVRYSRSQKSGKKKKNFKPELIFGQGELIFRLWLIILVPFFELDFF